jgi:hypothetical protein
VILGRPPLRVRGAAAPVQVVHVDDLTSALALAATSDLPGAFNVAADGWLDAAEARDLIPRTSAPSLPTEVLERWLRATWDLGLGDVPPGILPYLAHPWVIGNERLRAAGWSPAHTNADAIAEAVASLPPRDSTPLFVAGGSLVLATGAAVAVRRRRKRRAAST